MQINFGSSGRSIGLDVAIAFAIGLAGESLILAGLRGSVASAPITDLLAPGLVGLLAGILVTHGQTFVALLAGIVVGAPIASALGAPVPDFVPLALSAIAGGLGFGTGWGIRQSRVGMFDIPTAPSALERSRVEAELAAGLRGIDPNAPGAFERATVLLRRVNEQLSTYSMFAPPVRDGDRGDPVELLRIQAEVLEAARLAAIAAGASRFTVSGTGMGVEIQAIFGVAPTTEVAMPRPEEPY